MDMAAAQEDEMVERLLPQGAMPALQMSICIRRLVRGGDTHNPEALEQPLIQHAAKRAAVAGLRVDRPGPVPVRKLPEDAVVIVNQEPRHKIQGGLSKLLLDPIEG